MWLRGLFTYKIATARHAVNKRYALDSDATVFENHSSFGCIYGIEYDIVT
jgi:hypothetical protein